MRTNNERAALVRKRTAEIKRKRQKKKLCALDMICIVACLILVVGIGSFMPALMVAPGSEVYHASGAASLVASHGDRKSTRLNFSHS